MVATGAQHQAVDVKLARGSDGRTAASDRLARAVASGGAGGAAAPPPTTNSCRPPRTFYKILAKGKFSHND